MVLAALTEDISREVQLNGLGSEYLVLDLVIENGLNIQRLLALHGPADLFRESLHLTLDDLPLGVLRSTELSLPNSARSLQR